MKLIFFDLKLLLYFLEVLKNIINFFKKIIIFGLLTIKLITYELIFVLNFIENLNFIKFFIY